MKSHIRLLFACVVTILFFYLLSPMLTDGTETIKTLFVRGIFSLGMGVLADYVICKTMIRE